MQLVLPFEHMAKAAQYMEPSVFEYVREGEIESFERLTQALAYKQTS